MDEYRISPVHLSEGFGSLRLIREEGAVVARSSAKSPRDSQRENSAANLCAARLNFRLSYELNTVCFYGRDSVPGRAARPCCPWAEK